MRTFLVTYLIAITAYVEEFLGVVLPDIMPGFFLLVLLFIVGFVMAFFQDIKELLK